MTTSRQQRVERALFRGGRLTFENSEYRLAVQGLMRALVEADVGKGDLTTQALELGDRRRSAVMVARESGIVAGLQEISTLLESSGLRVRPARRDGDHIQPGDALLEAEGNESQLFACERIGLNLLQRMCGIATAGHCLQEQVARHAPARIVGTRKTPWGVLDKRALHVGGVGTHRLGLADAILIKNNHLTLIAGREQDAAALAVERAWKFRGDSAFIEVEVRSEAGARAAGETFRRLRQTSGEDYPCLIMLDNMAPPTAAEIVRTLHREGLWDDALIEASGGVWEATVENYAATGVDAISVGALTHSARALDISQRIS